MRTSTRAGACAILSLVGLGVCVFLGIVHVALLRGELVGGAACGGPGSVFNCYAVTGGTYGRFAGLPWAGWGLIGYAAALQLSLIAWSMPDEAERALIALAWLAAAFLVVDVYLLLLMVTRIHQLCPWCMVTYGTNAALLVAAKWAAGQRWSALIRRAGDALGWAAFWSRRPAVRFLWVAVLLAAGGAVGTHAAAQYVSVGTPGAVKSQIQQFLQSERPVQVATAGDPFHGPGSGAAIAVVEFSDFLCPACQKAFQFNSVLFAGRRDVRFVFKHFPLDMVCNDAVSRTLHPGACQLAAASECAHQQGKFWVFHDWVFTQGHGLGPGTNLSWDVQALGVNVPAFESCLASGAGMDAVRRDVAEGRRLHVTSTPTYFVNGLKMPGLLTPTVFRALTDVLDTQQ